MTPDEVVQLCFCRRATPAWPGAVLRTPPAVLAPHDRNFDTHLVEVDKATSARQGVMLFRSGRDGLGRATNPPRRKPVFAARGCCHEIGGLCHPVPSQIDGRAPGLMSAGAAAHPEKTALRPPHLVMVTLLALAGAGIPHYQMQSVGSGAEVVESVCPDVDHILICRCQVVLRHSWLMLPGHAGRRLRLSREASLRGHSAQKDWNTSC